MRQADITTCGRADAILKGAHITRSHYAHQAREGNLEESFKHENSSIPPALSCHGKMRTGQKSELITCVEVSTMVERPLVDAVVFDSAAIVNMLPPGKCKTFKEYAETVFLPHIVNVRAQNVKRIDLVWDRYLENSLKQSTCEGQRHRNLQTCVRQCSNFFKLGVISEAG